ncbi:MAG: NAD(+) diphosphatase [Treponema sp.]|jgi:NAD+ diphosphatase|nr:NAD(+) diphosphatase [Treponema sp.]
MNGRAFFFLGDLLVVPSKIADSDIDNEQSLELVNNFQGDIDVFEVPALDNGGAISVVSLPAGRELPPGWRSIGVRQALGVVGVCAEGKTGRMLRAFHIAQWRRESAFCGSCGAKNTDVVLPNSSVLEPQRHCPACGRNEFPRISPAMIVMITDDDNRILLAHNSKFRSGVYSHISGFSEPGETLEATVTREVMEEVNVKIRDIAYIQSQPWPFPNSLMLGFYARYESGIIKCDGTEITDAGWFTKETLPELPGSGSLSRCLIDRWLSR